MDFSSIMCTYDNKFYNFIYYKEINDFKCI